MASLYGCIYIDIPKSLVVFPSRLDYHKCSIWFIFISCFQYTFVRLHPIYNNLINIIHISTERLKSSYLLFIVIFYCMQLPWLPAQPCINAGIERVISHHYNNKTVHYACMNWVIAASRWGIPIMQYASNDIYMKKTYLRNPCRQGYSWFTYMMYIIQFTCWSLLDRFYYCTSVMLCQCGSVQDEEIGLPVCT